MEEVLAHCKHQLYLSEKMGDGATRRESLESVERQTGKRPKELDGPELPGLVGYIWDWYQDIRSMVSGNGLAPCKIPPSEYIAWCELTFNYITPFEFKLLRAIDTMVVAQWMKEKPKK